MRVLLSGVRQLTQLPTPALAFCLYKKMVEYHDILWDIATAKNSGVSDVEVLYKYAPPISSFFNWRDSRVMDEISWYGWFIGKFVDPM